MDCNSYSYAPTMLDVPPLEAYGNDDMSVELSRQGSSYNVWAWSYDGDLDVYESFERLSTAARLYEHIRDTYSDTPPGNELEDYIDELRQEDRRRRA